MVSSSSLSWNPQCLCRHIPLGGTLMPKSGVFVVTDELRRVLDSLPADEPRSRLEPFRAFILRWRREGRSFSRIQQILADECHVKVSGEAVRKFVQSRSRPRKRKPEAEPGVEQTAFGSHTAPAGRTAQEVYKALTRPSRPAKSDPTSTPQQARARTETRCPGGVSLRPGQTVNH